MAWRPLASWPEPIRYVLAVCLFYLLPLRVLQWLDVQLWSVGLGIGFLLFSLFLEPGGPGRGSSQRHYYLDRKSVV